MRWERMLPAAGVVLLVAALPVPARASHDPADQPPFGGQQPPPLKLPRSRAQAPRGYELSAAAAIRIARGTEAVHEERGESPSMKPRPYLQRPDHWRVSYLADGIEVAQVLIDDPSGRVLEAWRDHQVEVKLARGYEGAVAGEVTEPYVWLPLCALFLLPFVDPRRPFRLLHLDLLVLLGFGISHYFFNRGEITISVPLTYPVLGYLFLRMLWAGFRPRERPGPLVPLVPVAWLAVAAIALAGVRVGLDVAHPNVIDIGLAGVVGADRVAGGEELYEGEFAPGIDLRGDVYGPANYLAYVPFEQALPWSGAWDDVPAAHAAAIAFDLGAALLLFLLGRRLRSGSEGRALGIVLAFAWLAYPYTLFALAGDTNDALVALLVVAALLALGSPAGRGVMIALGAAVKFGPLALAPLFATGTGERRLRSALVFALAFAVVAAAVVLPLSPDGGPRELYDRTLGYQVSRGSPFSVWGLAPSLAPLQDVERALAVALGVAVALVPRRKSPAQVAALGAAVLIATQVGAMHWFYFSVVWFAPLVLVALFTAHPVIGAPSPARRAEQRVAP